ncbi:SMP-30/gluconolactonase/LRE family protein [Thalassobellus suaedae]|uniref:SMP-30/gluconolactonase/LRE family protein n=1 Tax=Thalassobellus suaedae TaxID=3074124 RepID=A0ABY9XSM1_9FLAO|nr:SMP-30/gluconolactonase/LRE family protein [Flavobacteriaceae bacterium HL-DH14]
MFKKFVLVCVSVVFVNCKSDVKEVKEDNNLQAELEYKAQAVLGEGAFWNYKTQELYWIDIDSKRFNIYNPETKTNKFLETPSKIGTVVPVNDTIVLAALEDGVYKMNINSGTSTLFTGMKEDLFESRLNDGKCDPAGRFWVGSMHNQYETGKANLYSINSDSLLVKKIDSVTISNGIVWTSDTKTMYYIDTPTSQIRAYDYNNETGDITNARVAVQIPESLGMPDGMSIDEENMLWVGMWNGNAVIRFNPITGKVDRKVNVPAHNITSCAFGGKNLDTLYITSARTDMTDDELKKYPLSGSVFKVVPGIKGVKSHFFKEK